MEMLRAALGDEAGTAAFLAEWPASQAAMPTGELFLLDPSFVWAAAREAALDPDLELALTAAARRLAGNPLARALAWHVYHRLFRAPRFSAAEVRTWPVLTALLGEDAGLLYILALLGALPEARALHRAHGVPESVVRVTLHDLQRWADHYRRHRGTWGVAPAELPWFRLHMRGDLYDLGRLQFQPDRWSIAARAFRHRTSGAVIALSEAGVRYTAHGLRAADGEDGSDKTWTARLAWEPDWVIGHRITPMGMARKEVTHLARADWAEALVPGDPVLQLHIPRAAPLDLEACRRSLEAALRFFASHFPNWPFVAFACESWLLDPRLDALLAPAANLVRFQRQMYLVPKVGNQADSLEWVFDGHQGDLARAPRDTSLRRAVLNHLEAGGELSGGGCFLFPEDLPAWGTDTYRRGYVA
jgi:hypothetical protein